MTLAELVADIEKLAERNEKIAEEGSSATEDVALGSIAQEQRRIVKLLRTIGADLHEALSAGRIGWMDSISFQHELGSASGGNTVFPSKKQCLKHHTCISGEAQEGMECTAIQVRVLDEEALIAALDPL